MGRCWTTSTPRMCETLSHCWFDAGPTSKSRCPHCPSIGLGFAGRSLPSKRQTLGRCRFDAGPTSQKVGRHWAGIGSTYRVWWLTVIFMFIIQRQSLNFWPIQHTIIWRGWVSRRTLSGPLKKLEKNTRFYKTSMQMGDDVKCQTSGDEIAGAVCIRIWCTDTWVNLLWKPSMSSCPTRWWDKTRS